MGRKGLKLEWSRSQTTHHVCECVYNKTDVKICNTRLHIQENEQKFIWLSDNHESLMKRHDRWYKPTRKKGGFCFLIQFSQHSHERERWDVNLLPLSFSVKEPPLSVMMIVYLFAMRKRDGQPLCINLSFPLVHLPFLILFSSSCMPLILRSILWKERGFCLCGSVSSHFFVFLSRSIDLISIR